MGDIQASNIFTVVLELFNISKQHSTDVACQHGQYQVRATSYF